MKSLISQLKRSTSSHEDKYPNIQKRVRDACTEAVRVTASTTDYSDFVFSQYIKTGELRKGAESLPDTNVYYDMIEIEYLVRLLLDTPVMSWKQKYLATLRQYVRKNFDVQIIEQSGEGNSQRVIYSITPATTHKYLPKLELDFVISLK